MLCSTLRRRQRDFATYSLKSLRPCIATSIVLRASLAAGDIRVVGGVLLRHGRELVVMTRIGKEARCLFDRVRICRSKGRSGSSDKL